MSRFDGVSGKEKVLDSLVRSPLLRGLSNATELANSLFEHMTVNECQKSEHLIRQGEDGDDVLFILLGSVRIEVNGHLVAHRVPRDTIGEIAAMNPGAKRSADVITDEKTCIARISAGEFNRILGAEVGVWRNLAEILAFRLGQRNSLHREPNKLPTIFIGSSGKSYEIALALKKRLEAKRKLSSNCDIHCWKEDVFKPSKGTMEALEKESANVDFAVLVAGADDIEWRDGKKQKKWVARDNVIFEAGLFMGALSRCRTIIVCPTPESISGRTEFKLPSDLDGITTARYTDAKNLGDAVDKISSAVREYGVLTRFRSGSSS